MKRPSAFLSFRTREEWRSWLERNYASRDEAWLLHPKVGSTQPGLAYLEAVEEALCFGWIDGLLQPVDKDNFALRYSPRKKNSIWSPGNKTRALRLIRQGRMTQAGLQKVAEARANGQWKAASEREDITRIPPDLMRALRARVGALPAFRKLAPSLRKQYLYWMASAKRPATRHKRSNAIVREVLARKRK